MKHDLKVTFNAPVTLSFSLICLLVFLLNISTGGVSNSLYFVTGHTSLLSPLTWFRFISHVFGHASWSHLIGNISYILLLGPMLEEKYGSEMIAKIIGITAVVTGIANYILFTSGLLGASGVVFAFILLSSITSIREGEIPLTFLLVALIYLGEQVYSALFVTDNIANFAHIIGGSIGAYFGFKLNK